MDTLVIPHFAIYFTILGVLMACFKDYLFRGPKIRRNGQPLRRPPDTLPIAGNGLRFLQSRHKLFSWFVDCERLFSYETFEISVPSLPAGVVINDPRNLEHVFKNEGIFGKGDFVKTRSRDLFGYGIINADGELWKAQRKAGLHFLNIPNLKALTNVALPSYLRDIINSLRSKGPEELVDLEDVFHEVTTQLMGQMAYDMDMHAKDAFSIAFEYASGKTGERFQNPLWQVKEIFLGRRFQSSVAEVKGFGAGIVSNAVKARESRKAAEKLKDHEAARSVSGSLINSLLDSIPDHQIVADAALNYLSAGRDTTAQALTWTLYLLMRNPRVVNRMRKEVQFSRVASPSDLTSLTPPALPYTMAVFYESLRLYPPVPFEIKQCQQPTTLPDGTFLPRNTVVVWCTWAMNRSVMTWGSDSNEFRPERWIAMDASPGSRVNSNADDPVSERNTEDGVRLVSRPAWEFPVFNGGARTCLGKKMAEAIAAMVLAAFVSEFDFTEAEKGKERVSRNSLTLPMDGGLPCFVRRRSDSQTAGDRWRVDCERSGLDQISLHNSCVV